MQLADQMVAQPKQGNIRTKPARVKANNKLMPSVLKSSKLAADNISSRISVLKTEQVNWE